MRAPCGVARGNHLRARLSSDMTAPATRPADARERLGFALQACEGLRQGPLARQTAHRERLPLPQSALAAAESPELLLAEHLRELLRALKIAIIDLEMAADAFNPKRLAPPPRRHLRFVPGRA